MSRKVQATKNYRMFHVHDSENRPLDIVKHGALKKSMVKYGSLDCYPIVAYREKDGKKVVKDGQHRLALCEELGLPVYWIETATDFDVAIVNSAQRPWQLADYARKFASNGVKAYSEILEFVGQHRIPIGTAAALLAGTTTFANCQDAYTGGTFKVKDRAWADAVAGIYGPLVALGPAVRSANLIGACMAVCRVKEFDPKRLLSCAGRCRELLVSYSTRDAYLDMLDKIYNFGRQQRFALKFAAVEVMRSRNIAANGKKHSKAAEPAGAKA